MHFLKTVLLFFGLIVYIPTLLAQSVLKSEISGTVVNTSNGIALEYVNVYISNLAVGQVTDSKGKFKFTNIPMGRYEIKCSLLGYETVDTILLVDQIKVQLNLHLSPTISQLSEVTIQSLSEQQVRAKEVMEGVNPVTIITAREIENRASNLNELIARTTGVQIRQSGAAGSSSSISIRGLEGKRVQVFLDGNPLNTPDGSFGINDLPLAIIERIEVYKGTIPAHLGGDGLGSAVNVVLRHRHNSYIDASITRQSFNTTQTGLILKKNFEKAGIEYGIGAFYTNAENDYTMNSPFQDGLKIYRDHDKFKSLLIGNGLKFNKLWFDEIEIEAAYIDNFKELQGVQRNIQFIESRAKTKVVAINMEKKNFLTDKLDFKYSGVFARFNSTFIDTSSYSYNWDGSRIPSLTGRGELGVGPNNLLNLQTEWRSRLNLNYQISEQFTLNLNNTFRRGYFDPTDDLANQFAKRNLFNWPADLANSVTGLTAEHKAINNTWTSSIALKHYLNIVHGYNTNINLQNTPDKIKRVKHDLGYNLGLRIHMNKYLFLKTSHERAIRLPSNAELFGDGALITPSLNLLPEVAYNYNIGLVYDKIKNRTAKRFQIETNAFLMYVQNLIQLGGSNGLTTGFVNYAKARILGVDIEIKKDLTEQLYVSMNATSQRVIDANKYIPGTQQVPNPTFKLNVPNIPSVFGNWNVEYHKSDILGHQTKSRFIYEGSWSEAFNYGFAISVYDGFKIPGYLTHNLIVEQSFKNDLYTLTGEIRNLTNSTVINNWNQPLPGRSLRIKFRVLLLSNNQHKH